MYLAVFIFSVKLTIEKRGKKGLGNKYYMRPLCERCKKRPKAVNYQKNGKTYYRKNCEECNCKVKNVTPRWAYAGYVAKNRCEKCGYISEHPEVFRVFHIDGNLNNCRYSNLKTVCSNCAIVLGKNGVTWKQGDLTADY